MRANPIVKEENMSKNEDISTVIHLRREQMLRLVAKSFYNELINYGVTKNDILAVAGHLLDNVIQKNTANKETDFYNRQFTIMDIDDEWASSKRLAMGDVSLEPVDKRLVPLATQWLQTLAIRNNFHPSFPETEEDLELYFQSPSKDYFSILHNQQPVGLIGAEEIDRESAKLEMRKLIGDPGMQGKGIGKKATFLFLYHVFVIRKFRKVYVYSLDINVRNLNLNSKFGFELEGVFFEDVLIHDAWRDVLRMALNADTWLEIFS